MAPISSSSFRLYWTDDVTGVEVAVVSGSASVYAGTPGASSHRMLATVPAGQS